jgi:hypothetical protein
LRSLVQHVAASKPLLLISTIAIERDLDAAYARGTTAQVWELPDTGHTKGLAQHPADYRRRVLQTLARGLR